MGYACTPHPGRSCKAEDEDRSRGEGKFRSTADEGKGEEDGMAGGEDQAGGMGGGNYTSPLRLGSLCSGMPPSPPCSPPLSQPPSPPPSPRQLALPPSALTPAHRRRFSAIITPPTPRGARRLCACPFAVEVHSYCTSRALPGSLFCAFCTDVGDDCVCQCRGCELYMSTSDPEDDVLELMAERNVGNIIIS